MAKLTVLNTWTPLELELALAAVTHESIELHLEMDGFDQTTLNTTLPTVLKNLPAEIADLKITVKKTSGTLITGPGLTSALQVLPVGLIALDLSENALWQQSGKDLAAAFQTIVAHVCSLNLSKNGFGLKSVSELATIMTSVPHSVASLNLSGNNLNATTFLSADNLVRIIRSIPETVLNLNFSDNRLANGALAEETLAEIMHAFPSGIIKLDLSGNLLGEASDKSLEDAFLAIPSSVGNLNLSRNGLDQKSAIQLKRYFSALPPNVTMIHYDERGFISRDLIMRELDKKCSPPISIPINNHHEVPSPFQQATKILARIRFDEHLKVIHTKILSMQALGKTKPHYKKAAHVARTLLASLLKAKTAYLETGNKASFVDLCNKAIKKAEPDLKKHRGWKQILANLASLLVFIATLGIYNLATGKGVCGLFRVPTKSARILAEVEKATLSIKNGP